MTLTPYASTSSGLAYLEEMEIEINGTPYRTRDIDGRVGIKGAELYGTCSLGGKLKLSKYGIVTWAPTARGYFTCTMDPYPGNKVK